MNLKDIGMGIVGLLLAFGPPIPLGFLLLKVFAPSFFSDKMTNLDQALALPLMTIAVIAWLAIYFRFIFDWWVGAK